MEYKSETEKVNKNTGELYYIINFIYQKLSFTFTTDSNRRAKKLFISGSFHYFFNKGLHNANDFYFIDFIEVVNELKEKFNIKPEESVLRSLEYGVNISIPKYETRLILQNIFYHQRKKFVEPINKPYKQAGNPKQNDFIVKVYDKGFQYPKYTNGDLLRFEIKYMRMRELNKIDIIYLSDLLLIKNHFKLRKILLQRFREILFYDYTISTKYLTKSEQKNILNYSNINFWENILLKIHKKVLSYDNFDYHKKRLKKIIQNYSENIQINLIQIIDRKTIALLNMKRFSVDICQKAYTIYTTINNEKCTPYTHLYIGWKNNPIYNKKLEGLKHQNSRICLITGIDISMQRDDSSLLSHTGLYYLHINNKKLFEEIKRKHLTKKWLGSSFSIQIREMAHNIRDSIRTQRNKQKRLYPPYQEQLFNINI